MPFVGLLSWSVSWICGAFGVVGAFVVVCPLVGAAVVGLAFGREASR